MQRKLATILIISLLVVSWTSQTNAMLSNLPAALPGQFPFAVYIELFGSPDYPCTGIVIDPLWVMVSGLCILPAKLDLKAIVVVGGGITDLRNYRSNPLVQVRAAVDVVFHPDFFPGVLVDVDIRASVLPRHNWALIKLDVALDVEPIRILALPPAALSVGFDLNLGYFGYGYTADLLGLVSLPSLELDVALNAQIGSFPSGSLLWADADVNLHFFSNGVIRPCDGDGIHITRYQNKWWVYGLVNVFAPFVKIDLLGLNILTLKCASVGLFVSTRLDIDIDVIASIISSH